MYGIARHDSRPFSHDLPAATVPADARIIRDFIALRDSGLSPEDRINVDCIIETLATIWGGYSSLIPGDIYFFSNLISVLHFILFRTRIAFLIMWSMITNLYMCAIQPDIVAQKKTIHQMIV